MARAIGELVIIALIVFGAWWLLDNIRFRKSDGSNKEGKD